jgi:hypothetical protein
MDCAHFFRGIVRSSRWFTTSLRHWCRHRFGSAWPVPGMPNVRSPRSTRSLWARSLRPAEGTAKPGLTRATLDALRQRRRGAGSRRGRLAAPPLAVVVGMAGSLDLRTAQARGSPCPHRSPCSGLAAPGGTWTSLEHGFSAGATQRRPGRVEPARSSRCAAGPGVADQTTSGDSPDRPAISGQTEADSGHIQRRVSTGNEHGTSSAISTEDAHRW